MANHCIDVACRSCGYVFCLRGCRYPRHSKIAIRDAIRKAEREGKQFYLYADVSCPDCGKQNVIAYPD